MVATTSNTQKTTIQYQFLVIGYGNELRGDEGIGPWVARSVDKWQLPSVKALAVPQLLPELTSEIAKAKHVIFVDACARRCAQTVQIDPLVVRSSSPFLSENTHYCDPHALLSLTHTLHGSRPRAWLLQVAAKCFDLGCELSDTADQGCDRALQTIAQFLTTYQPPRQIDVKSPALAS